MEKQRRQRILFVTTMMIYVAFGMVTSVIGVIIDKFQSQYDVSLQIAALLPFAFYLSYGFFSVPFGVLMDRFGARFVLITGMVLMTSGSFLLYLSNHYILVILTIFLTGVGVTAIQAAGNPFIRELDAPSRYTANLTIIIGVGALGYAFSPMLVPFLQARGYSWNLVYLSFAILSLILLIVLILSKLPKGSLLEEEKFSTSDLRLLIRTPLIVLYALGIFLYVGAEVGTSSYIVTFMRDIHKMDASVSLWESGSIMALAFPSATALAVGLFWLFQALGRIIIGPLMNRISPRSIFIFHSAGTVFALIAALVLPPVPALISFILTGYFTAASFTAIYSAALQSFDKYHGAISGILCTAIIGGALISFLVGYLGDYIGLRLAMGLNVLAFGYVFALAVFGKGKLDITE